MLGVLVKDEKMSCFRSYSINPPKNNMILCMVQLSVQLNSLDLRRLDLRWIDQRLTMLHNIILCQVALPYYDILIPNERASRPSQSQALKQIQTTADNMKFSFFTRTIVHWNALPSDIVNLPVTGFSMGSQPDWTCISLDVTCSAYNLFLTMYHTPQLYFLLLLF